MKTRIFYINEGSHFDISDDDRKAIVDAGLTFYKQYNGYLEGKYIVLFRDDQVSVTLPFNPDIFVH